MYVPMDIEDAPLSLSAELPAAEVPFAGADPVLVGALVAGLVAGFVAGVVVAAPGAAPLPEAPAICALTSAEKAPVIPVILRLA